MPGSIIRPTVSAIQFSFKHEQQWLEVTFKVLEEQHLPAHAMQVFVIMYITTE